MNCQIQSIERILHYNALVYAQRAIQIVNAHFDALDLKKIKKHKVANATTMKIDNDEQLLMSSRKVASFIQSTIDKVVFA